MIPHTFEEIREGEQAVQYCVRCSRYKSDCNGIDCAPFPEGAGS